MANEKTVIPMNLGAASGMAVIAMKVTQAHKLLAEVRDESAAYAQSMAPDGALSEEVEEARLLANATAELAQHLVQISNGLHAGQASDPNVTLH